MTTFQDLRNIFLIQLLFLWGFPWIGLLCHRIGMTLKGCHAGFKRFWNHVVGVFRGKTWQKMTFLGVRTAYIYIYLFDPFTNIFTLFRNTLLHWSFFLVCILSTVQVCALILGYKFRGTVLFKNISASTAKKREQQQQQQHMISEYSCVYLLGVRDVFCWRLYVFPEHSCALLCVTGCSCVFPCVLYASKLASVGHYLSLLWPKIGLCCRFSNPVRSQCYNLDSNLVGS